MSKHIFKQTIITQDSQSAKALGSGSLEVFSTPALCALMENTAIKLLDNEQSVGVEISIEHLKATKTGDQLHCTATMIAREGRSMFFSIEVKNDKQDIVGRAKHTRVVIDPEKFMAKL